MANLTEVIGIPNLIDKDYERSAFALESPCVYPDSEALKRPQR